MRLWWRASSDWRRSCGRPRTALAAPAAASPEHPVAFCCAEFGVHGSLPIYSGGLGILAGDILKEASDWRCRWSASA